MAQMVVTSTWTDDRKVHETEPAVSKDDAVMLLNDFSMLPSIVLMHTIYPRKYPNCCRTIAGPKSLLKAYSLLYFDLHCPTFFS